MYRYNRLDAAREYARENGYTGAMFPWQTADDGSEETQEVHYNPEAKSWGPDLSRRQRHVSIAVFVNVWRHVSWTGDHAFLREHGAELMLDIARFWGNIATFDEASGKYHIDGVMGPDEFHEKLPGSDEPGVRDNAYTNIMVVWLLEKALAVLESLPPKVAKSIRSRIGLTDEEEAKWRDMTTKLNVIVTEDGIVSQFDGYMDLPELDWDSYRQRFYSIHRMDRILKAEGDSPDNYKVAKQADTLMTWYLLEPEEVARILRKLGHEVEDPVKLLKDNYDFYEKRTSHGSTLSKVVHAVIAKYIYPSNISWDWFMEAMDSDIHDTQGGDHRGRHPHRSHGRNPGSHQAGLRRAQPVLLTHEGGPGPARALGRDALVLPLAVHLVRPGHRTGPGEHDRLPPGRQVRARGDIRPAL